MKELFIPFELSLKLKQKGFDELCMSYYSCHAFMGTGNNPKWKLWDFEVNDNCRNSYEFMLGDSCTAPLWQQVIDWLREKHSIRIVDDIAKNSWSSNGHDTDFKFNVIKVDGASTKDMLYPCGLEGLYYPSYYEAMQKAIEFALTKIS